MKRSQMVELMKAAIARPLEEWQDAETQAYMLLTEMEDAGMLPPEFDNFAPTQSERLFSSDSDFCYHGKDKDGNRIYSLTMRRWEDE